MSSSLGPKCGNPYEVLGVHRNASEAQIKKAFRDLSLKLHPDKRKSDLTSSEIQVLDKKFHDITEARSFLLDPEHAEAKKKYDEKLASESLRRVEDEKREKSMSVHRKRMRDELTNKIQTLQKGMNAPKAESQAKSHRERKREPEPDEPSNEHVTGRTQRTELEMRQVHLKWSRSKIGAQSEASLRKLLQEKFGSVERVEIIGGKGNAALVTFASISSCNACVDALKHSDEMRATHISKQSQSSFTMNNSGGLFSDRDKESVDQRKLRQAAEREALLREMESGTPGMQKTHAKESTASIHFPPEFPSIETNDELTPLQRLEFFEKKLLKELST